MLRNTILQSQASQQAVLYS